MTSVLEPRQPNSDLLGDLLAPSTTLTDKTITTPSIESTVQDTEIAPLDGSADLAVAKEPLDDLRQHVDGQEHLPQTGQGQVEHPYDHDDPIFTNDPELTFIRERLHTIASEERFDVDPETIALEEFEKATRALIASRVQLKSKDTELTKLEISDSRFQDVQVEIVQLTKTTQDLQQKRDATKEVYYREFGPITDTLKPVTETKEKAKQDIQMLQDQIAHLQKQLDAVSLRRKQMAADAEEHHRRMAEHGGLDDDDV
ncbi:hypothetical protein BGZ94_005393, partial [Podila epigama]